MFSSTLRPEAKIFVLMAGPTGAGKSAAALSLAERLDGEIINADSMQVYRGFDIGTDKPSAEDRRRVPHHLLDIVDGRTQFTAADFAARAVEAIEAIRARGRLPFVVGGTGLYVKALLDGLFPGPGRNDAVREALEREARDLGLEVLWERLREADPAYGANVGARDRVRIVRALEVIALTGRPMSENFRLTRSLTAGYRILKIGLTWDRAELYRRIEARVDRMFERGWVEEAAGLLASGVAESAPPFRALGYEHVLRILKGEIGRDEAAALTKIDTRHYAKRQLTWFRKMEGLRWFRPDELDAVRGVIEAEVD
jgi:tRNA dimethylallyltransferase